ncbi:MAG TPA: helix-hairpin-helix domain-containing protein [Fimbriimonadales bacterium]|nr:helix-hairpin-helix domain-containing protein [Fimbriimonadales bacterium]
MLYGLDRTTRIGLLAIGGVAIGAAGWLGYQQLHRPDTPQEALAQGKFPIHVAGAVKNPSVIYVTDETLVIEAIEEVGGATKNADTNQINLAAKLVPNTQLYIPEKGEEISPDELGIYAAKASPPSSSRAITRSESAHSGGLININTATEQELEELPGIGPVTAKRIVEYRLQTGGFKNVEQLLEVKGIGPKKLAAIRPFVTVQ